MRRVILVSIDGFAGFYWTDNHAFFLAVGPGIRRGATVSHMSSRDVAPTIAHLLGFQLDQADGRLLTDILA